jgi:hypothetical protein
MLAPNSIIDSANYTWSTEIRYVNLMRFIIDAANFDWSNLRLIKLGVNSQAVYCIPAEIYAISKLADKGVTLYVNT